MLDLNLFSQRYLYIKNEEKMFLKNNKSDRIKKNIKTIVFNITFLMIIAFFTFQAVSVDAAVQTEVGKWKRFEVSYTNSTWSGNPFDLEFYGNFTHTTSGRTLKQLGFYAGNNTWKIYFMPDRLGEWTFTTVSTDQDLDGRNGSFNCVESGLPGRLMPDGRRWKLEDSGKYIAPIMIPSRKWLKSTHIANGIGDFILWGKNTVGARIIGTTLVYLTHDQDESPYIKGKEGEEFYIPMWDRLNDHYDAMRDQGMGHYIMLYSDDAESPDIKGITGYSDKELRLFKYLVARFSAYPMVMWDSGIDIGETRTDYDWYEWFVDWFKTNDPWQHPVSSRTGGGSGGHFPSNANYYSDGHYTFPDHTIVSRDWNLRDVPTAYTTRWREDYYLQSEFTPDKIRRVVWEIGLVGGTAVYIGGNNEPMAEGKGGYFDSEYKADFKAAPTVGYAATFFNEKILDLGRLDPHHELVTSGSKVVLSADIGIQYIAYMLNGGSVSINLSGVSGTIEYEWYNPRSGTYNGGGTVEGGAIREFVAPDTNDWVLNISNSIVTDSTGPETPQGLTASAESEFQINLTWQSSSDPESGISKYIIYRDDVKVGESASTAYTDTGLNEGTFYSYEVSAVNGAGLESDKSFSVAAATLSDTIPPLLLSVSVSSDALKVDVIFSEPVEQTSAENISNYSIDKGIIISEASLGSDLKTVSLSTFLHDEGITYTLTINNIADRAIVPNTIADDTQKTYSYVAQLINNLSISNGKVYEVVQDGLLGGELIYTDRVYTITNIPPSLEGATFIRTSNDDKSSTDSSFLTFDVNQDVTVYVAHDDTITTKPSWLLSFTDLGDNLVATHTTLSIFAKDFPSGTVVLGGNEGTGANSMYIAIITEKGVGLPPDTNPPSPPTGLKVVN